MRLPMVALFVPLIFSGVMWAITGSAMSLLFGLLSPLVMVAHFVDARLQDKRKQRKELTHLRQQESDARENGIAEAHEHRQSQLHAHPASSYWAQKCDELRPHWAVESSMPRERRIRVGVDRHSGLPVIVDADAGIAVVGNRVECGSVHRALAVQLSWRWGMEEYAKCSFGPQELPENVPVHSSEKTLISLARHGHIPPGVRYVLEVVNGVGVLKDMLGLSQTKTEVLWDYLTRAEHQRILSAFEKEKRALGSITSPELPKTVVTDLPEEYPTEDARGGFPVYVGKSTQYPVIIDLAQDGPHAIVVGRTGSGKTEFMRTWIVGMCASYTPESLNVLIVDYKGGTGFQDLESLTHVCGIATDLATENLVRMVTSLRTEIRAREKILVTHKVSDISLLPEHVPLARLVVVIDEYWALREQHPELAHVITDIASRGRALGMHLILSSQRLTGTISDTIVTNCPLRVSFSLSDTQEYAQLFGLSYEHKTTSHPGRALLVTSRGRLIESQMAIVSTKQIDKLRAVLSKSTPTLRMPWIPPLPKKIFWDNTLRDSGKVVLGLADYPERQTQSWLSWVPQDIASLLILGKAHSGKSNLLALMAEQLGTTVISDSEDVWDCVMTVQPTEALLIDDFDYAVDQMGIEHKEKFLSRFPSFVRHIRHQQGLIAATVTSPSRYETMLSAVWMNVCEFSDTGITGRLLWNSEIHLQVPEFSSQQPLRKPHPLLEIDSTLSYIVVTPHVRSMEVKLNTHPGLNIVRLGALGEKYDRRSGVFLADVDTWQTHYALLSDLKEHAGLILDNCSLAEMRALRLNVGTLPYVHPGTALLVPPGGAAQRVKI